ncbi:hypothetical protein LDENG_00287040 [Lucifuga dentata]|nr:hypothetical protein LDENG_00287040 [Lucifuga dentata]
MLVFPDFPHLNGQQRIREFEQIFLRFVFPSFYNNYGKSCCKLYPGGCYKLLDSAGYTCDFLKGRVTKIEHDGWIEFKILNAQSTDGGFYRCSVLGTQNHIYSDYYVEVSEATGQSIHPLLTTTSKAPSTSETPSGSTGPILAKDHSGIPAIPWNFSLPLAAIVSITITIFITLLISVVCCSVVKAKHKHSNKYGETLHDSSKQEVPEMNGIVYTTVDFKPHQKPTELYANMGMHRARAGAPNSTCSTEQAGMVEYSTLAIHQ